MPRQTLTGYDAALDVLRDDVGHHEALEKLQHAVDEISSVAEAARQTEAILHTTEYQTDPIELDAGLEVVLDRARERFPEATITTTIADDARCRTTANGITAAIQELVANAIEHNDADNPTVDIDLRHARPGWVELEIADDGPGIPQTEITVLETGETPLRHSNSMGLWMTKWVVNQAGGTLEIPRSDDTGTTIRRTIPTAD